MNTIIPTASEVLEMRQFLTRVIQTAPAEIKVTGNPATDENTDLLKFYRKRTLTNGVVSEELETLGKVGAVEIMSILAGWEDRLPDGTADTARGAEMFRDYIAQREPLYQ
jgi:hypothetical protein